jgi:hypothetical protein
MARSSLQETAQLFELYVGPLHTPKPEHVPNQPTVVAEPVIPEVLERALPAPKLPQNNWAAPVLAGNNWPAPLVSAEGAPRTPVDTAATDNSKVPTEAQSSFKRSRLERINERVKKTAAKVGFAALSLTIVVGGSSLIASALPWGKGKMAEETAPAETTMTTVLSAPAETTVTVTVPAITTTLPPVTEAMTLTPKPEPAPTTTTTQAPITTTTETVAPTPVYLSVSEQIAKGMITLEATRGQQLGTLRFDKFCDDVQIYVGQSFDPTNPAVIPALSADAQAKAQILLAGGLTSRDHLMLEDDILQAGLPDGSGDPMYKLSPAVAPDQTCAPTMENPRAQQIAYGSSEATAAGEAGAKASDYQAVADLSEFGSLPGQGKVTYIQGHRSSQSAAFNGLYSYNIGDTVTYAVDGQSHVYNLAQVAAVDATVPLADLITFLGGNPEGKEQLVLQVCIDGQENSRSLYIFEAN